MKRRELFKLLGMAAVGAVLRLPQSTARQRIDEGAINQRLDQLALHQNPVYLRRPVPVEFYSQVQLLRPGKIIWPDTPYEIVRRPTDEELARLVGDVT